MFGDKLKALRRESGYSMDKLAELYNAKFGGKLNKSTISRYENNLQEPIFTSVKNFAELFGVTIDYITDAAPSNMIPVDPDAEYVRVPVIGRVAAGLNCLAESNIVDYEFVPANDINTSEDHVFLVVQGDSMYPEFKEGDLVLVRLQSSIDSGRYAVVIIDGEDGVIKRVVYGRDYIELQSINPMYPPRRFEGPDVMRVRVYGLVKEIKRKF